jgi:TRAP-type C4-dicarboxylate transport system permease small subunit
MISLALGILQGDYVSSASVASISSPDIESARHDVDLSRAQATIIRDSQAMKAKLITIERQLKGLGSEAVVAPPSLPDRAVPRHGLAIMVLVALVVGFVLLCFIMLRNAIEIAKQDPVASAKLMRIRDGFRWRTRLTAK